MHTWIRNGAATLACLTLLLAAQPAQAQSQSLTITQATASVDGSTLFVQGAGFGTAPVVSLGGLPLGGVQSNTTGTSFIAGMPMLTPGSYLLQVTNGRKTATFEFTLGSVGPQGPQGPAGPPRGLRVPRVTAAPREIPDRRAPLV